MDGAAQKLLECATQRTLHAHAFSRSSSQASLVLTDLLSRYLSLLTSTCAKYAQHAGRTELSIHDAIGALDELGVGVDELNEYCATEGKEFNRYALHSARRVEDLNEFRAQLSDGLRQDRGDAIHLEYTRYTTPPFDEGEEDEEEDGEEEVGELYAEVEDQTQPADDVDNGMTSSPLLITSLLRRKRTPTRPATPPLPLSPISNPSSPSRKRPRTASWQPPAHIPNFLPPFPTMSEITPAPSCFPSPHGTHALDLPSTQSQEVKVEKPPLDLSQPMTSSAASDFLVQVPYSQSSLSALSERHLPSAMPPPPPPPPHESSLATPLIEPSLVHAYHYILTHPPPAPSNSSLSRHKVSMTLLNQIQDTPRWEPADTLFASVGPCPPRVATIGPSYPVGLGDPMADIKGKGDSKEKDFKFPPTIPRPVAASDHLLPLISQQPSRIPDLSRSVLPPAILARVTRLGHPPVLHRGTKPLTYGGGIPAPWNANAIPPTGDAIPPTPVTAKPKDAANGNDPLIKPVIPDARLFATWDFQQKDFKTPLNGTRARRLGSMQVGGSGVISLGLGPRVKNNK
ncbi:hypothetical protein BDQ12DRAFT_652775 [Crucibulum laeve]|uniref:Bromodomain associated domain-containing protein n=1 Tax=Crucibulum laeve TaxID=68775 RepID=A0A5C3M0J8_9AGAR|nr:hypothetical protein BDQ12DRAFT_652775 [Crucibulum laeve]